MLQRHTNKKRSGDAQKLTHRQSTYEQTATLGLGPVEFKRMETLRLVLSEEKSGQGRGRSGQQEGECVAPM